MPIRPRCGRVYDPFRSFTAFPAVPFGCAHNSRHRRSSSAELGVLAAPSIVRSDPPIVRSDRDAHVDGAGVGSARRVVRFGFVRREDIELDLSSTPPRGPPRAQSERARGRVGSRCASRKTVACVASQVPLSPSDETTDANAPRDNNKASADRGAGDDDRRKGAAAADRTSAIRTSRWKITGCRERSPCGSCAATAKRARKRRGG